jgi:hypothetical protein
MSRSTNLQSNYSEVTEIMASDRGSEGECGVVLFRTLYNYIERESNRRRAVIPTSATPLSSMV